MRNDRGTSQSACPLAGGPTWTGVWNNTAKILVIKMMMMITMGQYDEYVSGPFHTTSKNPKSPIYAIFYVPSAAAAAAEEKKKTTL